MRLSTGCQAMAVGVLIALSTPLSAIAETRAPVDNATTYSNCRSAGGTMHACCDKVGGGYTSSIKTVGGKTIFTRRCTIVSAVQNKLGSTKTFFEELPQVAGELQE